MGTINNSSQSARQLTLKSAIALMVILVVLIVCPADAVGYVCGDHNGDGAVDVADAVHLIQFVFAGGPAGVPAISGDANCDGAVNVGDAVCVINYVFRHGPEPCSVCPAIDQHILFEMSYSNYAWLPTYHGFYIDNNGYVIQYNYIGDIPYASPWNTSYTEEQLMERFNQNPTAVCSVSEGELYHHYAMISGAQGGPITSPMAACLDAGIAYYVAYVYDEESGLYNPILLYQMGDMAQKNLAPEAETLFYWMMSLIGYGPQDIFCGYPY